MDDFQPVKKKAKKAVVPAKRFKTSTSDEDMTRLCKADVPPNTKKNTDLALRLFSEWRAERNKKSPSTSLCPDDLLEIPEPESINFWVSRFVNEVQKLDGSPYPPRTLHQILSGLQRHVVEITPSFPKFLDLSNPVYRDLHGTCDTVYRELQSTLEQHSPWNLRLTRSLTILLKIWTWTSPELLPVHFTNILL